MNPLRILRPSSPRGNNKLASHVTCDATSNIPGKGQHVVRYHVLQQVDFGSTSTTNSLEHCVSGLNLALDITNPGTRRHYDPIVTNS